MFGHKSGPSKRYTYGCRPPTKNAELLEEHFRLAHVYRNRLVEIERDRRQAVRAALLTDHQVAGLQVEADGLETELTGVRDAIAVMRQQARKAAGVGTEELDTQAKDLLRRLKGVRTNLKAAKREAAQDPQMKARLHDIEAESHQTAKAARAECGLYWGTYLTVEQGMDKARKAVFDPKFRRWNGEGTVAVQIQGGLPVDAIFGNDTRLQIDSVPEETWMTTVRRGVRRSLSWTRVRLRVGSSGRSGRDPVWAELPVIMYRPLPDGGKVKWAHLVRTRVGTKFRYELQITVEMSEGFPLLPNSKRGAIGIDVGWRLVDGGMRVAYWSDDESNHDQLLLPQSLLDRFAKVDDLRAIRDQNFNMARDALVAWLRTVEGVPDWFRERAETLHAWRSPGRLAALVITWREQRFPGDDMAFAATEAWRKQDKHLMEWEANLRDKIIRHRREVYRVFAAQLAERYGVVCLEEFDLRNVARRKEAEEGVETNQTARYLMRVAAASVLRQVIEDACKARGVKVVKVPSEYTTRRCHHCGQVDNFDAANRIFHTCSKCGEFWDQDHNASINILRSGIGAPEPQLV